MVLLLLSLGICVPSGLAAAGETIQLRPYQRRIPFTGFTRAKQSMLVSSEVSGRCLAVHADVGDFLSATGLLAELDTTFITIDLQTNRIARDKVRRQLALETKTLNRYATLHDRKSVPQATLDEVTLKAELHELSLQNLQIEQRRLQERLDRHTIKGPPGWQVIERFAEPGEYIQSGQKIARLGDFRQLLIPLSLSFSELQAIRQMEFIPMLLPDLDASIEGRLFRTSPDFDRETRKINTELIIEARQEHLDGLLRGGMRVQLHLRSPEQSKAFVLPLSALVSRYDAHWLVTPGGQRVEVIYLGIAEDYDAAIVTGKSLSPGDRFLIQPPKEGGR